jgi:hypothetical protein
MRIWVDADACPRPVKDMICKAAERTGIKAVFVANSTIPLPRSPMLSFVRVAKGFDVADDHIVSSVEPGDLVVTQDIPLAAELVDKGAHVVNPRGEVIDVNNAAVRLSSRNFAEEQRNAGLLSGGGPSAFGEKDKRRFAGALDRWLAKARRKL